MKKALLLLLCSFVLLVAAGCRKKPVLHFLNWGDYISDEVIADFEAEYGVKVEMTCLESNEAMYTQIKAGNTSYDVAVPSDYLIHKLYKENLLYELDFSRLPNLRGAGGESVFDPALDALRADYFPDNEKYAVPYFWGTIYIMYRDTPELKTIVETEEWNAFFAPELQKRLKIGMYNVSRDAIAIAQFYLGLAPNRPTKADLAAIEALFKAQNYYVWAADNNKQLVASGNLDLAIVYSGDFFEMLAAAAEEGEVTFTAHAPQRNNVWFDGFVIPKTSRNVALAHTFINFISAEGAATKNALYVGYCPAIAKAYANMQSDPDYAWIIEKYPFFHPEVYPGQSVVYEDLGPALYRQMEILLNNVKTKFWR